MQGQQIAESESFNDNNDEGIPFPQWDKVKRRYYRLSRGKKARIDDVDQAFFDEDSFDPRYANFGDTEYSDLFHDIHGDKYAFVRLIFE